jgi:hypothetical protein
MSNRCVESFDQRKDLGKHHFVERVPSEVTGLRRRQHIFVAQQGAFQEFQPLTALPFVRWRASGERRSLSGQHILQRDRRNHSLRLCIHQSSTRQGFITVPFYQTPKSNAWLFMTNRIELPGDTPVDCILTNAEMRG